MDIILRHLGITILCLLTIFDSYGQLAPTSASVPVKQFTLGSYHTYSYESTVLLNEAKSTSASTAKDVGYQITAQIDVASIWQDPTDPADKLLQIQLKSPVLHIKSRKAPAPEGFVSHTSQLESLANEAFLVRWNGGQVEEVFFAEQEERSMRNLKRGIASLFQFKTFDIETSEKDVSGKCVVQYSTTDGHSFTKTKTSCTPSKGTPALTHPDKVLGTAVSARRDAKHTLKHDLSVLESVETSEYHEMTVALRREAGSSVQASQQLKIIDNPGNAKPVKADTVESAVKLIEKSLGITFKKQNLVLEQEPQMCQQDECPSLAKLVKENKAQLETSSLGTFRSASAFVRLWYAARNARKEEFVKILKHARNADILPQLLDLAATAQTQAAHSAAMKVLDFNSESDINLPERYLWSLSMGSHPLEAVITDILSRSETGVASPKLSETLTLTAAGMTSKWLKLPGNSKKKLKDEVKNSILQRLSECKADEECKQVYIRAIKNLGLPDLIPTLIQLIKTGGKKTTVNAMKSLHGLSPSYWDEKVRTISLDVFLQLRRRYDSSARTLAADILLESGPTKEELYEIIQSLRHTVTRDAQEVGQYVLQRLRQLGEKNAEMRKMLREILLGDGGRLNGYHVLAQRGMATAFTREFLNTPSSNGTLVSTLELAGGILKRSTLDVVLEGADDSQAIFTLGMFAGGLSSFVSSDDGDAAPPPEDDESATAGMELTVLGVNVRPFVFFSGQGELMGHVWSGTGSERTPAFQALLPLQDHLQVVALQSGFVAELSLQGALSFDLAGEVQLSLWNRNAHSVVEKNAGVAVQGLIKVDSSFVRSQVEFNVATEPRLNLVSDVNFYNTVALCLQLKQPDSIVKHNIHKVERIPGSKHRLRKSKYKIYHVSGKTYALNKKNNEMCNVLFQE